MKSTFLQELFNPQTKNLFTVRQRAIYVYSLLFMSSCFILGIKRLFTQDYFLVLINGATFLSLLLAIYITRKKHVVFGGLLLSAIILVPSIWVILNNTTRIADNAMYIAFVPIVNLFLMRDKRISFVIFLISTVLLAFLFTKAALLFLPFLTIFFVHLVYFFFFGIHIDQLEEELIDENKRKQLLINDLELKNKEIEKLNRALGETNKRLQEKVEDIKQFAYLSSHNLQTPLSNMQVYSDLLLKEYTPKLDELGVESIKFLSKASTSLSTILHGLVDYFSTFEHYESEKLVIEALIDEILIAENDLINQGKVKIEFQDLPTILGYRKEIKRLFQSLIQNALIHNQSIPNLKIELITKDLGDKIQFSVIDNGVGIPEKDFEKIFKIYVSSISFNRGIGLAIAKKIVANYNGEIWVTSTVGEGTAIHFTLEKERPKLII